MGYFRWWYGFFQALDKAEKKCIFVNFFQGCVIKCKVYYDILVKLSPEVFLIIFKSSLKIIGLTNREQIILYRIIWHYSGGVNDCR